ncbi:MULTISPECIES: extracellular solute-binding protein [unclassified Streptococcus]|uniref:extracellular solute-binding protein n=1 Tax=unclassified Streptococcus TaxID=2608887 RepID=UPI00107292EC|nr:MULTISPECIES: extracellular solute-binding protein [unclassified Streptococcus]MBF0786997.1 extracellular solute-binding protein [Streptococcus sp. 19428wC2_LYSM12]MCQ9212609.1 extracellular solute-binding protein [Streptococcus sp. B01]MCQ9213948.1 extracellular solute-binding protein [Streptococcus sp. O1]TFV06035.1 extracellular solute-binding protein [Streptococcus sp. LYSM12]
MKRTLFSFVTVGILTMGALTACSSTSSTEAPEGKAGKTEVEFWFAGGKTAVNVWSDMVEDYNQSQDKYEVKIVTQADYNETFIKLQAALAGNKAPDVVLLDSRAARNLNKQKLLADMDALGKASETFDINNYLEVFANQAVSEDGKRFGLPAYGTTQILYYNQEAFKKANINPASIKTWQDLGDVARKIKDTGEFQYGWEPMWGQYNLIDASLSNGAKLFSEDGKTVTINAQEWIEVWEQFRVWIHDDQTMKVHSGGQGWEYWYKTIEDVLDNTAGGYTGSSGDQADLDFTKVQAMEQPAWDTDSSSVPAADALLMSILESSTVEEKRGAFEFIQFFTNVENQIHWTKSVGYVAVNKGITENQDYQEYIKENPQALVPFEQAKHGSILPVDPTGGAIYDALKIAADKVELENIPAKEALNEAQETAQKALDKALKKE